MHDSPGGRRRVWRLSGVTSACKAPPIIARDSSGRIARAGRESWGTTARVEQQATRADSTHRGAHLDIYLRRGTHRDSPERRRECHAADHSGRRGLANGRLRRSSGARRLPDPTRSAPSRLRLVVRAVRAGSTRHDRSATTPARGCESTCDDPSVASASSGRLITGPRGVRVELIAIPRSDRPDAPTPPRHQFLRPDRDPLAPAAHESSRYSQHNQVP